MRYFIITLILLITSTAQAAQLRIAENDAEIVAIISAKEVSRIALEGDRIISLATVPRGFSIDHDEVTGDLFLVPIPGSTLKHPINLFITSEQGFSYQLLLEPRDLPSEQIIIRNARPPKATPVPSSPRREELGRLMKAAITGELIDDYKRAAAKASSPIANRADIVGIEVWQGVVFEATRVKSITGQSLPAADSLAPDAAAVWVAKDGSEAIIITESNND